MLDLAIMQCAHGVAPSTMAAIVAVESSRNPYAIGVVGGRLQRQPQSLAEAVATARELERQGRNYSVGLAQVNRANFRAQGLTIETAFDPCQNLRAGAAILRECYNRAGQGGGQDDARLRAALSCYYSGNFTRGQRPDKPGELSYVDKVVAAATGTRPNAVPAIGGWEGMAVTPAAMPPQAPRMRSVSFDVFEPVPPAPSQAPSATGSASVEAALAAARAMTEAAPEAKPTPAPGAGTVVF